MSSSPLSLLFIFILDFSLESDEICYPSVFLHSKNSVPSTAPLCLVVKNDRSISEFSPPIPIQNGDQWDNFVRENNLVIDKENEQVFVSHNLIYRVSSSGQIYPWQLPYSIQSEKCHASTGVELNVPLIIDCQPMTELTQESCLKNPLSAIALAADDFILEGMNTSVSVNASTFDLYPPVWRDGNCINFVLKARIIIFLNKKESEIEAARVDRLIYGSISSANFSRTIPEVEIRYEQSIRRKGDSEESGFEEGDFVLLGDSQSIWRIPLGVECIDRSIVRFEQDFVSSCIIAFSLCSDAQNGVNSLLSSLPSSIFDSPFIDNTTKSIPFVSPRQQTIVTSNPTSNFSPLFQTPLDAGCTFPSGVSIVITHSLSGPVQYPKRVITSALISHQLSRIPSIPSNSTVAFIFSLKFIDVTPDPTHTFSSPPRIDLRLPNDFFYPFLFNSAFRSSTVYSSLIILFKMLCFK
ncbi:tctn-1 [Pristionchus pacificus]|uniref:Tctn-1 n=1 Tax=Pristionchus pacificus TaxID=54126 RepID=A0A2A6CC48_PRIPA|nr:tctn-1 [Pristionchus pacificus]|eukprot:PDM75601.1 tctn-1 [Pristionchus pacificus]